ncbi:membrane protein [Moritella viscosa]|nr:membrane protein [Moritella viscosa]
MVYYGSVNQKKALEHLLWRDDCVSCSEQLNSDIKVSLFSAYIFSFVLSPFFILYCFKRNDRYLLDSLKYNLDGYLLSIGIYISWYIRLKKNKPTLVVMSNDHNPINRTLMYACNDLSIKTLYVQHAPAVKGFPQLDFSYAFLEGQHAYQTYRIFERCKVTLVGSNINDLIKSNKIGCLIGISTGLISQVDEINDLVLELKRKYKIILRPHPADHRMSEWKNLALKNKIEYSNPCAQKPIEYLNNISILVGPMSGLLLEAAIKKVPSFCFNGSSSVPDWYSLLDNNVCIKIKNAAELFEILAEHPLKSLEDNAYEAAKFYYEITPNKSYMEVVNEKINEIF